MKERTDSIILERVREMRQKQTPAEAKLWWHLRGRQLGGYKFRRQHPIAHFIVDFYCHEAKLVVELDGESHAFQEEYDRVRTEWLEAKGFQVMRFWNHDVLRNVEGALNMILEVCEARTVGERK